MLIPFILGATAVVVNSISLFSFLNDSEEETALSNASLKNILTTVAVATVVVIAIRFMFKLVYGVIGVANSEDKQSERKRLKNKLQKKKKLKLKHEETHDICRESVVLEDYTISETQEKVKKKEEILSFENVDIGDKEFVSCEESCNDEKWIHVEKKVRKKKPIFKSERISDKNASQEFFGIDGTNVKVSSVANIRKSNIVGKYSEGVVIGKNVLTRSVLGKNEKSKTYPSLTSFNSGKRNTFSVKQSEESHIRNMILSDAIESDCNLKSQYLKQNKKDDCSTYGEKNSVSVISKSIKLSSNVGFSKDSEVVSSSNDKSNKLAKPNISSGLHFECVRYHATSVLYKEVTNKFRAKLNRFRRMHSKYCVRLMNKLFEIRNGDLVESETVNNLFLELTPHTEILFFMMKVFLLVSFSTLSGGKNVIDHIRYCSTYFYNQKLLDVLISKLIKNFPNSGSKLKAILENNCEHLSKTSEHDPYSGEFFSQVFDICNNLSLVELPEEEQKLVDFAILTCAVYSGHMIAMLYRMISSDDNINVQKPLCTFLEAQNFSDRCHNIKRAVVHMYHPYSEDETPSNIGGEINVPLIFWRICSKDIHHTVKNAINECKMDFYLFVKDIVSPIKRLMLSPNTRRFYQKNIDMYEARIKTARSLLPLPQAKTICPKDNHEYSKSL